MISGVGLVKSIMVEGLCPVMDFGVPPFLFAEVRSRGPVWLRIFRKGL